MGRLVGTSPFHRRYESTYRGHRTMRFNFSPYEYATALTA